MSELSAVPRRDMARAAAGLPPPDSPSPPPFAEGAVAVETRPDPISDGDGPAFLLVLLGIACLAIPKTAPPESWAWFTCRALIAAAMLGRFLIGLRGRWRLWRSPPRAWIVFEPERLYRLNHTDSATVCLYASRSDMAGILFTRSSRTEPKGWHLFLDLRGRGLVPFHWGKERTAVAWLAEQVATWAKVPVTWREETEAADGRLPPKACSDLHTDPLSGLEDAAAMGAVGLAEDGQDEAGAGSAPAPSRHGPAPSAVRTPAEAADPETGRPTQVIRLGPDADELRRLPRAISPGADNTSLGPESVGYRVAFPATQFGCALMVFVPILFISWYWMEACYRQADSGVALLPGGLLLAFGLTGVAVAYLERFRRTYLVLDPEAFGHYHFRWWPGSGRFFRRDAIAAVEWVRRPPCEKSGVEWVHPDGREKPGVYHNAGTVRIRTHDGGRVDLDMHQDNPHVVEWLARRLARWAGVAMTRVDDGPTLPESFAAEPPVPDPMIAAAPSPISPSASPAPGNPAPDLPAPASQSAVRRAPVDIDAAYVALADEARQYLDAVEPPEPRIPAALCPEPEAGDRPAKDPDARRIPPRFALRSAGSPEFARLWRHFAQDGTASPSPDAFALEDRRNTQGGEYIGVGCTGLFCLVWVFGVMFISFLILKQAIDEWLGGASAGDLLGLLILTPFWTMAGFLVWQAAYYLWGGAAFVFDGDRLHLFRRGAFRRRGESVVRAEVAGAGWQPPSTPGQPSGPLLLRRRDGSAIDLTKYRRREWQSGSGDRKEQNRPWSWLGARIAAWAGVAFVEEANPERDAVRLWTESRPPPRVTPLPAGSDGLAGAWRRLAPDNAKPLSMAAHGWLWKEIGHPWTRIGGLVFLTLLLGGFSFFFVRMGAPWLFRVAMVAGWMFWSFVLVDLILDAVRRRGLVVEPERMRILTRSVGLRREVIVNKADILRLTGERTGWRYRLFGRRCQSDCARPKSSGGDASKANEGFALRAYLRDGSTVEVLPCGVDEAKDSPQLLWLGERLAAWAGVRLEERPGS